MTEKFRKLMGIKAGEEKGAANDQETSSGNVATDELSSNQAKLFENLSMQYSIARMSTHTHRGVGLGFGSSHNRLL